MNNTMTAEAQRIAIAKACGVSPLWSTALPVRAIHCNVPDYLNDLNAMHEAEKTLTDEQHKDFRRELKYVCGTGGSTEEELSLIFRNRFSATAAQRAEAFLRALNLWAE